LGNLEDAIEWAGRLGGIEGKISTVYKREETFSILRYISESIVNALMSKTLGQGLQGGYIFKPEQ